MKKSLLLMFALLVLGGVNVYASKVYADLSSGSGVGSATWTSGTNTFAWNASSYAYMVVPGGSFSGDLSEYTTIGLTVASIENEFRVDILANGKTFTGKGINTNGKIVLNILQDFNLQWHPDLITKEDLKSVTAVRLNTNSNSGSAIITNFYIEKPTAIVFNGAGKANIDKSDLTATGGLSYDPSSGVLTSNGEAGTMVLELSVPADLRNVFHYNVSRSGTDDIISRLRFYDEDGTLINTWNSIKLSNTWNSNGIDDHATNAFLNNKPVKKLVWESDANATNNGKILTISSVEFTCKTISCAIAGETQLKTLPWNKIDGSGTETPAWNMNGTSDTYYGNYSGDPTHYADLTSFSELRVYCKDNNTGFRCFFINAAGNGTNQIHTAAATWNSEEKYYSLDLSSIEKWNGKVALKAIKAENDREPSQRYVTNIVVYNTPAADAPKYILTGSGFQLAETVAALADETATCIDATGVKGITTDTEAGRTLLTSANPNCLFLGTTGNGGLANTQNVITSGTCANLVLTDGYPFKAPADFTATSASYATTISTAAEAGTLCLPFAATLPTGVTAYALKYTSGTEATAIDLDGNVISANTPVLINGSGSASFTGSNVPVVAAADNVEGAMTGVFEATAVPVNSYVLQNGNSGVGFYKVSSSDPITIKPFRAYLTAQNAGAALRIVYPGDATGIESVEAVADSKDDAYYTLSGVRVSHPVKGLYIKNGKKVMVK